MLLDLTTEYFNDKNSSTLELITVYGTIKSQ